MNLHVDRCCKLCSRMLPCMHAGKNAVCVRTCISHVCESIWIDRSGAKFVRYSACSCMLHVLADAEVSLMPQSGFHCLLPRVILHVGVFECACPCNRCCLFRAMSHPALCLDLFCALNGGLTSSCKPCRILHAGYGFLPWLCGFRKHVFLFPTYVVCTNAD